MILQLQISSRRTTTGNSAAEDSISWSLSAYMGWSSKHQIYARMSLLHLPQCMIHIFLLSYSIAELIATMYLSCLTWHLRFSQMAYELHGLLAGNVSIVTGENIRPSYGGDEEAFLKKVVTPIYRVIRKVLLIKHDHMRLAISFPQIQILIAGGRQITAWKDTTFCMV